MELIASPVLLPLLAAWLYVAGALLLKRSTDLGVGVWRTGFVSNIIAAVVFQPLLLLGGTWQPWNLYWQPAMVGFLFLLGQVFTVVAFSRGDVSVATPVMGVKILLVAVGVTVLVGEAPPLDLWLAAGLSIAAIALLNARGRTRHHHLGLTILNAGAAAACFALFDVLVQKWGPAWGVGCLLPAMFWFVGLYAFAFVPMFRAPLKAIPRGAWPWLVWASVFIALQGVIFVSYLAKFGNATAANVVYASRGLWTVVAVWLVGHWFHNAEQHLERPVLQRRLAGAALMLAAIVLVVM
jgi:drug/metabolite transporter (DMT)-like permease